VFHSHAFTAYVELAASREPAELSGALAAAGFQLGAGADPAPTNVSVAGESQPVLGPVERDPSLERGYWLWGAADNLRVAAANALSIAERLLAS